MRIFLILGLLALTKLLPAQSWCDAIIEHRAYNSLKRIAFLNTKHVDSSKSKDSLVLTYFSKEGKVIKQENFQFRRDSCTYNKSTTYFNSERLPVFIEYFEQPCATEEERTADNSFVKLTYWYERFEYTPQNGFQQKLVGIQQQKQDVFNTHMIRMENQPNSQEGLRKMSSGIKQQPLTRAL